MARNHDQPFRPLRPGITVCNEDTWEMGTLGLIARDAQNNAWIVSCHHVLWSPDWQLGADGEAIIQPAGGSIVAHTDRTRADETKDIAAAKVAPGLAVTNDALGIGVIGAPQAPTVGMRVVKSGAATGVTEGVVEVAGDHVKVVAPSAFPVTYELTSKGDSGAVWICMTTGRPVALHQRGNNGGREFSEGLAIAAVLAALSLTL
jgi:hypothetical protein